MKAVKPIKITLHDGRKVTYIGESKNGFAYGKGKMIFEDRSYEIGEYYKNDPNGPIRYYNEYGTLISESHYKFGMLNGSQIEYDVDIDHSITSIKNYVDDKLDGISISFSLCDDISISKYKNGKEIAKITLNSSLDLIDEYKI